MPYFNNAATTWPKPEIVYETVDDCFRSMNSPARTISDEGERSSAIMQNCRREVAEFLGIRDESRLVFTPSCTYALNLAIHGMPWQPGDVVLISGLEHHAVSRPIRKVARERNIRFEIVPYRREQPVDLDFIEDRLQAGRVRLLAFTMASNVTGDILPTQQIGELARQYGATFLADAAQSAGVIPIDVERQQIDMLSLAGHKGLFGPPGVGGLYVGPGIELDTLAEGGTGQDSGQHEMSGRLPSSYEVGTHNLLSIVGVTAGVRWLQQAGLHAIRGHESQLTARFMERLRELPRDIKVYGSHDLAQRISVVSLTMAGTTPNAMATWLAEQRQVVSRAGYHCAPLAHESIGSLPGDGTIRFSFGYFNTESEIDELVDAITAVPTTANV